MGAVEDQHAWCFHYPCPWPALGSSCPLIPGISWYRDYSFYPASTSHSVSFLYQLVWSVIDTKSCRSPWKWNLKCFPTPQKYTSSSLVEPTPLLRGVDLSFLFWNTWWQGQLQWLESVPQEEFMWYLQRQEQYSMCCLTKHNSYT